MFNLIGKTLGQYRILEKVGVGGMATVYKAYQPSMDRYVAIKVLPPQLSDDEQFVKRFQREAHAIAKLEHAHILPVFDYGEAEGITYIVMRYIPAGTLKEYLTKGRLPLDEVARIIGQIGSALDYAHQLGVIHRDVKPNNVLMGEQDNTYLTDFGLARMLEVSQQLTGSGVGVGTPAYMAPEQGLGYKADHRSDIYSLGVILYEMVTGHVPYEAETPMAVVLKHINEPLPLPRTILPDVPEVVELVILKALAKEPAHRYQSAADLVEALNAAVRKASPVEEKHAPAQAPAPVVEAVPTPVEPPFGKPQRTFWQRPRMKPALAVVALAIFIALGFLLKNLLAQEQANLPVTLTPAVGKTTNATVVTATPPPTATAFGGVPGVAPTESTQGKRVFYCEGLTPMQICVLDVQSGKITQITKDLKFEGQMGTIAWSPDGERLVFSGAQRSSDPEKLFMLNADGTGLKQLSFGPTYDHQSVWSPDGQWIAFARSAGLGLIRPDGSEVHTVLPPPENCGLNAMAWSPDNRRVALMIICGENLSSEVWVVNLDGSDRLVLHSIEPGVFAATMAWSPDGSQIVAGYEINKEWHRVFLNADGSGKPQGIDWEPDNWDYGFWPQWGGGALALGERIKACDSDLCIFDVQGQATRLGLADRLTGFWGFSWASDGKRITFAACKVEDAPTVKEIKFCTNVYVVNRDGTGLAQLTRQGTAVSPVWSPDGEWIAYWDNCSISMIRPDGTDSRNVVPDINGRRCFTGSAWSPDSQQMALAFVDCQPANCIMPVTIAVVNRDGSGLRNLAQFQSQNAVPFWSPDGRALIIEVSEGGKARHFQINSDDSEKMIEIDSMPESWYPWYWPQWGIQKAQAVPTPAPVAECRVAFLKDDGNVYVRNCNGSNDHRVTNLKSVGLGVARNDSLSWSPDGSFIVFQSLYEREPGNTDPLLYRVKADGSDLIRLTSGNRHDRFPVWSPDGKLIAFHSNCRLITINPDGSGERVVIGNESICPNTLAWSPDGKQLAFVSWHDPFPESEKFILYVSNSDGTNLRRLGKLEGGFVPTWSPDGKQIGIEDGDRYLFNADGSGEPVKVPSIPASWYPWYWPQWDKVLAPAAGTMTEQARAFAEPILKAIADRKPDFADDFSTANKGWNVGNQDKNEWFAIQDGVARLGVSEKDIAIGHESLNRKDFVLQLDARVAEGYRDSQLIVNFHNLSSEYWFYVTFDSASGTWSVDKRLKGQQTVFASGQGNVSPFGEITHVMIVARGKRAAVYLNGSPVAYFEDPDFDVSGFTGLFCQSDSEAVCEFDNVRSWNLANVPGLP